jgi:hypothetical protein
VCFAQRSGEMHKVTPQNSDSPEGLTENRPDQTGQKMKEVN